MTTTRQLALYATWASLGWACLLTGLAAGGNTWVLDRVAGGYFAGESMPVWLRAVYGAMTLLMLWVGRLAAKYARDDVTHRQRNLGRLIMLLFALSAVLNAISQSSPERYNAIGAAITVIGIGILRKRPQRDWVDLRGRR